MVVTLVSGTPIYPGLNWTSVLSWALIILGYPAGIGIWYLLVWCTNKKVARYSYRPLTIRQAEINSTLVDQYDGLSSSADSRIKMQDA